MNVTYRSSKTNYASGCTLCSRYEFIDRFWRQSVVIGTENFREKVIILVEEISKWTFYTYEKKVLPQEWGNLCFRDPGSPPTSPMFSLSSSSSREICKHHRRDQVDKLYERMIVNMAVSWIHEYETNFSWIHEYESANRWKFMTMNLKIPWIHEYERGFLWTQEKTPWTLWILSCENSPYQGVGVAGRERRGN